MHQDTTRSSRLQWTLELSESSWRYDCLHLVLHLIFPIQSVPKCKWMHLPVSGTKSLWRTFYCCSYSCGCEKTFCHTGTSCCFRVGSTKNILNFMLTCCWWKQTVWNIIHQDMKYTRFVAVWMLHFFETNSHSTLFSDTDQRIPC